MSFSIQAGFTGDKQLIGALKSLQQSVPKAFRAALVELGDVVFAKTQDRVPVKTGKLKGTGRVTVRAGAQQVVMGIHYGNDEVRYAGRVHEDLKARHTIGQAKYVESVVNETDFGGELASRVKL